MRTFEVTYQTPTGESVRLYHEVEDLLSLQKAVYADDRPGEPIEIGEIFQASTELLEALLTDETAQVPCAVVTHKDGTTCLMPLHSGEAS